MKKLIFSNLGTRKKAFANSIGQSRGFQKGVVIGNSVHATFAKSTDDKVRRTIAEDIRATVAERAPNVRIQIR